MDNDQARLRAAYETAVQALAPLPRAVFLLCRLDDLSYSKIGKRLSISPAVVEDCIAITLFSFSVLWRGRPPDRSMPPTIVALVPETPETSNGPVSAKHDRGLIRSFRQATSGLRNFLTHSIRQIRPPPAVPKIESFDEWLRTVRARKVRVVFSANDAVSLRVKSDGL